MSASIDASAITLEIPIYDAERPGLRQTLVKHATGGRLGCDGSSGPPIMRVLDGLTFHIGVGERVALLGRNGAGKTTLLNVLAGCYEPTYGALNVCGRVSTLLALVDPEPDGTVIENIRLSGILRGLRGSALARLVDDVLDFSELETYAHLPVRVLSSGMRMRLSFGVATGIACDVLLVDEIIGVGDAAFLNKATARFREAARDLSVLVLATHAIALAAQFCDRALLLDRGVLCAQGPLREVADSYLQSLGEGCVAK